MVDITQRSAETFMRVVQALIANGHETGIWEYPVRNTDGTVVATLTLHRLPTRPKDMPRAHRPKRRLSKRQQIAARKEKARVVA